MTRRPERLVRAVVLVTVGALAFWGLLRRFEAQRTAAAIEGLREDVGRARAESELCRSAIDDSESSLRTLSMELDSLRAQVSGFEAMDPRGVPEERYEAYLSIVRIYNAGAQEWDALEGELRRAELECRATIEGHNTLVDSLRHLVEENG